MKIKNRDISGMRMVFIIMVLALLSCRSETGLRNLKVTTAVDISLPPDAIYGNISSFSGLQTAVPDLFIEEKIEEINGSLRRKLTLPNQVVLVDQLLESNDDLRLINYTTISTSLPVEEIFHSIRVRELSDQKCEVTWTSKMIVQNQHRDFMDERITGIQEAYLFSLELLGAELQELLKDPDF